jgi:hypothetical protein
MYASHACRRQRRTEFGKGAHTDGAEIFAAIGAYVPPAAAPCPLQKKPAVLRITLKSRPPLRETEAAAGPVDGGPPQMASGGRAVGRRPGEHDAAAAKGGGEVRVVHLAESEAVRLRQAIEQRSKVKETLDELATCQVRSSPCGGGGTGHEP